MFVQNPYSLSCQGGTTR